MNMMTMRAVSDGKGGIRHIPAPFVPPAPGKKGKTKRVVPDPIKANPDSAAQQLRQFVERLERLHEERAGISDDIRDVEAEAKSTGFDTKGLRAIIALRKTEKHHRDEFDAILETYKAALGLA